MMEQIAAPVKTPPLVVHMGPHVRLTDEEFFEFCQLNRDLRIERTSEGEIVVMAPAGGETGNRNLALGAALYVWSQEDGSGVAFDSSTGFVLPNGAIRSPDAAWVRRARLAALTTEEKQRFLPLAPDFVVELRSPSDRLPDLQEKMGEYIDNGTQLGWLIDPVERQVFVYRPGASPEQLLNPDTLSGGPELPGLHVNLAELWDPSF